MSHPKKARLSWILVLEWRSEACCALVDPVWFRIEAHKQFGQHRYDANQHFFAGLNSIQRGNSFGHRSIQAACAFDGRTACVVKEFCSLGSLSPPTGSFEDEHDLSAKALAKEDLVADFDGRFRRARSSRSVEHFCRV